MMLEMKSCACRPLGLDRQHRKLVAFTLVELLVVLVIIGLVSSFIITSIASVTTTAREARTRAIVAAIDDVIQERYEAYKYRPLAVEIPNLSRVTEVPPGSGNSVTLDFEVLASESARTRLSMIRDLQRMELPDHFTDITSAPVVIRAAANLVVRDTGDADGDGDTRDILRSGPELASRRSFNAVWFDQNATFASGVGNVPAQLAAYRDRVPENFFSPMNLTAIDNQGAECLYLIMSTSFVGGVPAINAIPSDNIADTDNDGIPEILDGWGQPLGFIRWPVGYSDPELTISPTNPDDFDLFRGDFSYVGGTRSLDVEPTFITAPGFAPGSGLRPWSVRPLIISAGADGEFGITLDPQDSSGTTLSSYDYTANTWDWPIDEDHMGAERFGRMGVPGRVGFWKFPDPYLRVFVSANRDASDLFVGKLPGQNLDGVRAAEERADNISSYQSRVSR